MAGADVPVDRDAARRVSRFCCVSGVLEATPASPVLKLRKVGTGRGTGRDQLFADPTRSTEPAAASTGDGGHGQRPSVGIASHAQDDAGCQDAKDAGGPELARLASAAATATQ